VKHYTTKIRLRRRTGLGSPHTYEDVFCQVDLTIDVDRLAARLGNKAIDNKSRKSKLAVGITCEVHPIEAPKTEFGTVKASTLATTGRWDAAYNLAVVEWLEEHGLTETPENVQTAMAALKEKE